MVNFGYPYNDLVICKDSTDYLYFVIEYGVSLLCILSYDHYNILCIIIISLLDCSFTVHHHNQPTSYPPSPLPPPPPPPPTVQG